MGAAAGFATLLTAEQADRLRALARRTGLCDRCLGRFAGKLGHALPNAERGRALRTAWGLDDVPEPACALCEGLFLEADAFAERIAVAWAPFEASTFVVGSKVDAWVLERERALLADLGPSFGETAEPLKSEVNREVGKRLEARTGKRADFARPDLTVLLDTRFMTVAVSPSSVYLQGRYRKLQRGIPQTRWPCRACRGAGCPRCGNTGKLYPESVEELVAAVPMRLLDARGHAFHGMGREDIDALMLGDGRPFVVELKEPRRRALDLPAVQAAINDHAAGKAEVLDLRAAVKEDVVAVKSSTAAKSYVAACRAEREVAPEKLLNTLPRLRGALISQRTPSRVSHRRADLVRTRRVLDVGLVAHQGAEFTLRVTAEAGTYIKELVSSDGGRTEPSLAGLLGLAVAVTALDVVDVADGPGASAGDGDGEEVE